MRESKRRISEWSVGDFDVALDKAEDRIEALQKELRITKEQKKEKHRKMVACGLAEPVKDWWYYTSGTLATIFLLSWFLFAMYAWERAAEDCRNGIPRPPVCFKIIK